LALYYKKGKMTATSHESVVVPSFKRLTSLDACRGLVMFLMMAEVLESWRVAQARRVSSVQFCSSGHVNSWAKVKAKEQAVAGPPDVGVTGIFSWPAPVN
jgi:hypothetical protein